ncbi:hypothetical protein BH18VER1_BH18VER1_01900 [soil metagenome]
MTGPGTSPANVAPPWRISPVALWALLAFVFVACHYQFYFRWSFYEGGDLAANALQVRNAKNFQELYGNYSRFGFHHPGPAFFYVYAAAERLFFDLLKIVPTPFAAHSLAGALLQLMFFMWAIAIIGERTKRGLTIPLLLLFGGFYFGLVNYFQPNTAFQSIWSPHVLLMPFLCFLLAAASVAAGGTKELIPLAVAGSFLVHGHAAQLLFVIPLTLFAYAAWWQRKSKETQLFDRSTAWIHVAAAALVALFAFPLVIDLSKGEQSNLRLIARHFAQTTGEQKSFAQSAVYNLSFLCHINNPEKFCDQLNAASLDFLMKRWYLAAMWAALVPVTALLLRAAWRTRRLADTPFVRAVLLVFAAACLLTFVWGKLQTGALLQFNSYFNFAILFLVFVGLAIALASFVTGEAARHLGRGILVFALPLTFFASRNFSFLPDFPAQPQFTAELNEQIRLAALRDRQASRTKLLLIDNWSEAARVALALERFRYRFKVVEKWKVPFGSENEVNPYRGLANRKYAIWRVKHASTGDGWLNTEVAAIDPRQGEVLFSTEDNNAQRFPLAGWDISKGPYSWSMGKIAVLRFAARPTKTDVQVVCQLAAPTPEQPMVVTYNEGPSRAVRINGATNVVLIVPAEVWNASPHGVLKFDFPSLKSPRARGTSPDPRPLAGAFERIFFRSAP